MPVPESHTDPALATALARPPARSMAFAQRVVGGLFLLLMTLLLATVAWWTYAGAMRDADNMVASFGRLAANQAARMVESADLLLIDVQRIGRMADWTSPTVAELATGELGLLATELAHVKRLSIVGADGRIRASSHAAAEPEGTLRDQPFFAAHAAGGDDLFISPLLAGPDGSPEIVLSRMVAGAGGGFDGIVAVTLEPDAFAAFYRSLDIRAAAQFVLIRGEAGVLVREPPPTNGAAAPFVEPRLARLLAARLARDGAGPGLRYEDSEGRSWIAVVEAAERYPLRVVITMRQATVVDRWIAETLPYFAFGCLALIALAFLVHFSIRRGEREDLFRTALVRSNEFLEERVRDRTRSLEEALQQKDVLFRELNHRVKNNLQIVASLLRLQAARFRDPAVAAGFTSCLGRIQSMSAIHEMLYRKDDIAHVDFADYLGTLIRRLADSYDAEGRIAVDLSADPDMLDVETAVPLALLVNEVVSNSYKHAFPDGSGGRIAIEYRVEGGIRRLTARDDGLGVPPEGGVRAGSLGMQLARALASQLGGTFRQGPGNPGTITSVEFGRTAAQNA
ncbi:MAG: sensor histidine kinase [Alphaproteobacteria bacterium]